MVSMMRASIAIAGAPRSPQSAPLDEYEAHRDHVAPGCFVYAGIHNGRDVDLWGRWP